MRTIPAEMHSFKYLHKYPGMRPKDEVIWDKYIQTHPGAFDACWYNVPVGDPANDILRAEEMKRCGAWGVSTWRIDVVAVRDEVNYVIEIKPHADTHAIGEVLAYRALLIGEGLVEPNAVPVIITDDASQILKQACHNLGIACIEV